ncbi:hypothetical protein RyT2_14030 [Pseudolactococcus yaeyamensis]
MAEDFVDARIYKSKQEDLFKLLVAEKHKPTILGKILSERNFYQSEMEKLQAENQSLRADLVGIKLSSRQAQKNTDVILGVLNHWLHQQPTYQIPIDKQTNRHPFLAFYETQHKQMIDDVVQRKVYSDKAKKEVAETDDTSDYNPFD